MPQRRSSKAPWLGTVNEARKDPAKTLDGLRPRFAKRAHEARSPRFPDCVLERSAFLRQAQLPRAPIAHTSPAFDEVGFKEIIENPIETLFRDFEDGEKFGDRQPWIARDEVNSARMGAAEMGRSQRLLTVSRDVARGEEKQIHALL
jgi:hypothetical protein